MGLIVVGSDFKGGKYNIAQTEYSDLDGYIQKYEEKYLMELLGVELFKLFKADIDVMTRQPQTLIYQNIFNTIAEDDQTMPFCYGFGYEYLWSTQNRIRLSDGIKEMLLGFIYFQYMRDTKFKATPSGSSVNKNENAREAGYLESNLYERYNEGINSYHTIQWYILKNKVYYPLFNGIKKTIAFWP